MHLISPVTMPAMKADASLIGTPQSSNTLKSLPPVLTTNMDRDGPGQQVVQPPTAHQVGPDDSVLRLVEQLDLLAQADRLVPLQAWTCLDSFLFVGTTEEA
jgi:hypothetical protein